MLIIKRAATAAAAVFLYLFVAAAGAEPHGTIPVNSPQAVEPDAEKDPGLGFIVGVEGEFGGDKIATVTFLNSSDQDIKTGQGLTGNAGAHYRFYNGIDLRTTVGYKYVTTKADNADLYVDRIVLTAAADYFFEQKWFVGGGVVHHSGIKFHADGLGPDVKFKDATGARIEAGWYFVGVNYTFMKYKDEDGFKYDANNVGISFMWRF